MFAIQLISSMVGSVGFAILFRVRARYFPIVAILSGACYGTYYLFDAVVSADPFICALLATLLVATVSEILARLVRTPAIVFLISCIIPIVPGSSLYKAMRGLIEHSGDFLKYGTETLKIALGTAGGIVAISVIVNVIMGIIKHKNKE